jgi:hypothetical protein
MTSIGYQFQFLDHAPWAAEVIASCPTPPVVKLINPPTEQPFDAHFIGRIWIPDETTNLLIQHGREGAQAYLSKLLPRIKACPYIRIWEDINEPVPPQHNWSHAWYTNLANFIDTIRSALHQRRLRVVTLNWSVQQPPPSAMNHPLLAATTAKADYLGYHAYSWPFIHTNREHNALRYRRITQGIIDAGHRPPPVILTEAGLDAGIEGRKGLGWKSAPVAKDLTAEQSYFNQLAQLQTWAAQDHVWSILPFIAGPNQDWQDFDINRTLAEMTRDRLHDHPALDPSSSRKRGPSQT